MRLMIKQRVFTLTDQYYVYDESGEIRYEVKNDLFSLRHQLHVFDSRSGREIGAAYQALFRLLPEFTIAIGGKHVGSISKEFSFFVPKYTVDFRGWDVEGDLMNWEYTVTQNGRTVMAITKELFTWGDTYMLDYSDPADELPGLMLVLAIDAVNCDRN